MPTGGQGTKELPPRALRLDVNVAAFARLEPMCPYFLQREGRGHLLDRKGIGDGVTLEIGVPQKFKTSKA